MSTPSATIIAEAAATQSVTDATGRQLRLRRLNALDKLRLFKAVGPTLAQNAPYLGMAMLAFSVSDIDGVPVPPPVTEAQIESLVSRLGDPGLAAIGAALAAAAASTQEQANLAGN